MDTQEAIADQFRRAIHGEAWHGPSVLEILQNVTPEQAAAHPIAGVHSIGEILGHITAWQDVVTRRLAGETILELPPEQNWPALTPPLQAAWDSAKKELVRSYESLFAALAGLSEKRLGEIVPGKGYTVYVMVHGIVQHTLYHAGQIAVMKKVG